MSTSLQSQSSARVRYPARQSSRTIHRRQTARQIYLPLAIGSAVILGLAVLAVVFSSTDGDVSIYWSSISAVYLSILAGLAGLLVLVILLVLIYAVSYLIKVLPVYTQLGQAYVFLAAITIHTWADKVTRPVILIGGWVSAGQTAVKGLRRIGHYK